MGMHYNNMVKAKSLPDMIICDQDGALTRTSRTMARLASLSEKMGIPLTKAANWVFEIGNKAYIGTLGQEFDDAVHLKDFVFNLIRPEQEDSMFFLSAASEMDIPCLLLSNAPRKWGNRVTHQLHLSHFFENAFYQEDIGFLKPDPRCIDMALAHTAVQLPKNANIWVYGDMDTDVELAYRASENSPHNFIPVAIEGSIAAETIRNMTQSIQNQGLIFDDMYSMACYIRPETEEWVKKVGGFTNTPFERVDSYHLS